MESIIHADIFFFISSIGFVLIAVASIVLIIYLVALIRTLVAIARKIEDRVDEASEEMREFLDRLYDSALLRLFFGKKKHRARKR